MLKTIFIYILFLLGLSCAIVRQEEPRCKIAFTSYSTGKGDIYIINSNGTGLKKLTTSDSTDMLPSWNPESSKITFRSFRDGNPEIYTIDTAGQNLKMF